MKYHCHHNHHEKQQYQHIQIYGHLAKLNYNNLHYAHRRREKKHLVDIK